MARAFTRVGGRFVARFGDSERAVVSAVLLQVLDLVDPEGSQPARDRDGFEGIVAALGALGEDSPADTQGPSGEELDPALRRLFPAANVADDAADAEFRRLTHASLRARKSDNLRTAVDVFSRDSARIELDDRQAVAVAAALTDARLVLGERLGLRTEEDADRLDLDLADADQDDERHWLVAVYDFLTWVQETLTQALLQGI